jgi:putative lipoic acid-binding regulatory protein
MIFNPENKKPQIDYPCKWSYKIIGENVEAMVDAVGEIIIDLEFDITPSNISSKARYFSLNITVFVSSEEERDAIFRKLSGHSAIKFVM